MKKILLGIAKAFGTAGRATVALIGIAGITAAVANYAATQGSGTNFGSIVVSSVHYAQQLLCDVTTPSQCAAVSAAGAVKTDASATTQPVSGTVTANAGTNLNTSTLSTSANQTSELTKLDTIITNTGAAIPAGSAIIGKVGIDQTTPGTTNAVNTTNWPTTVDTNSGNKSANTPRFVIATDQPNLTTALNVALAANQSVNIAQIAGVATPVGSGVQATAQRVTLATDSPGIVTLGGATVANSLPVIPSSQYPANATAAAAPITASTTGTTGATTATLAGVASKTTFICGFTITSDATAALAGSATVTGTITGTLNYIQNVGSATAAGILQQTFSPCIPASATNTGIAVNSVAAGTGGNTAVAAWGYQL